jgi:hypothetical protein
MIPASELDELILSFCDNHWRKVARVAGKTLDALEARGIAIDGTIAEHFDARLATLIGGGQLEGAGNIRKWRYSEVRLPESDVKTAASDAGSSPAMTKQ